MQSLEVFIRLMMATRGWGLLSFIGMLGYVPFKGLRANEKNRSNENDEAKRTRC